MGSCLSSDPPTIDLSVQGNRCPSSSNCCTKRVVVVVENDNQRETVRRILSEYFTTT